MDLAIYLKTVSVATFNLYLVNNLCTILMYVWAMQPVRAIVNRHNSVLNGYDYVRKSPLARLVLLGLRGGAP